MHTGSVRAPPFMNPPSEPRNPAAPSPQSDGRRYEEFVRLYSQHEPALRAFVRSLTFHWQDTDEVMQETSLLLWRKFDQFEPGTSFLRWGCVVARFEALKFRRQKARDRHVFDEDLLDLLAEEAIDESAQLELERRALDCCMEKLGERERRWVTSAYAGNTTIKELAEQTGRSATSLYKVLNRIRINLLECVERSLKEERAV